MLWNIGIILIINFIYRYIDTFNILFLTIYDKEEVEINYNDDNICNICFNNKINICCDPCGHTYCNYCIKKTNTCYICKKNIIKKIKIYI